MLKNKGGVPVQKGLFSPVSMLPCQIESSVYKVYACDYICQRASIQNKTPRFWMDTR
jgi:hypothetical protein